MRRLLAVLLGLCALLAGCAAQPAAPTQSVATEGRSGLLAVALSSLPRQAQDTYDLILAGGPYPYRQDGQVFGNREALLPAADYGWYREYTIPTPGSADRGAQRFVVSGDQVFFYTDDHYDSFSEVIE